MAFDTQADDWEVSSICQAGGASGAGGGVWLFNFQSADANFYGANFIFIGGGMGVGGSIGGASFPNMFKQSRLGGSALVWSSIQCDRPFSAADLNWAPGRVTTAGLSLSVGYTLLYVSAKNLPFSSLFLSQSCNGPSIGVGATAMATVGLWKWIQDCGYDYGE
jgi:hypothetical protein